MPSIKFQKRPVVIESVQWTGDNVDEVSAFVQESNRTFTFKQDGSNNLVIGTLEGNMTASAGDWIIKGVHGEFYPCKPDIFEKTYVTAPKGLSRAEVYKLIDGERDYQDSLIVEQNWQEPKSVGAFLTLLRSYVDRADYDWTTESDYGPVEQRPSLAQIRKIAAIAVACMEKHGASARGVKVPSKFPSWK